MFEERHRPAIEFDDDDEEEGEDGEEDGGSDKDAGGEDGDGVDQRMRPKRVWEGPTVPASLLPAGRQFDTKDAQRIGWQGDSGGGRETIVDLKASCLCSAEEAVAFMKRCVIGVSVHELDEECCVMVSDQGKTVLVIESGPDAWEIKFSAKSADHFRSRNADPVLHAVSKSVVLSSKMSSCPEDFLGTIGFAISHRYSRKGYRVLLRTGLVAEIFCITTTDSSVSSAAQELPLLRIHARYEEKKAAERGQMTTLIASLFRKLGNRAVLISD